MKPMQNTRLLRKGTFVTGNFRTMKPNVIFLSLLFLMGSLSQSGALNPTKSFKKSVSLESRVEVNGISLVLLDDQIGVYHHFILEKSLDGKSFFEIAREDEVKDGQGKREILFKEHPFERNSIQCVFYRIRAVDELGWFDFTNTVTVMKKEDLAKKQQPQLAGQMEGQF